MTERENAYEYFVKKKNEYIFSSNSFSYCDLMARFPINSVYFRSYELFSMEDLVGIAVSSNEFQDATFFFACMGKFDFEISGLMKKNQVSNFIIKKNNDLLGNLSFSKKKLAVFKNNKIFGDLVFPFCVHEHLFFNVATKGKVEMRLVVDRSFKAFLKIICSVISLGRFKFKFRNNIIQDPFQHTFSKEDTELLVLTALFLRMRIFSFDFSTC